MRATRWILFALMAVAVAVAAGCKRGPRGHRQAKAQAAVVGGGFVFAQVEAEADLGAPPKRKLARPKIVAVPKQAEPPAAEPAPKEAPAPKKPAQAQDIRVALPPVQVF